MGRGVSSGSQAITLLPQTTIAGAVTAVTGNAFGIAGGKYLFLEAKFNYGSGGTTAKFWVQTRAKNGTWRDIANFAFTTAAATKFHALTTAKTQIAVVAASDAALGDDALADGLLGDEIRVKYTTTGTYAGATNITISVSVKGS